MAGEAGVMLALALALAPTGAAASTRALYAASGVPGGPGTIAQVSVRTSDGMPTPLDPPAVETGGDPQRVAVTSHGRFAYATAAEPGLAYAWRFGDGHGRPNGSATDTHSYRRPGRYTVTVTVTDDEGCSSRKTYTGQTTSCNGGPQAVAKRRIRVR
jgi:hypothetical protein